MTIGETHARYFAEVDRLRAGSRSTGGPIPIGLWFLIFAVLSVFAIILVVPYDRVVTSTVGRIVSIEHFTLMQALDPSIVTSLDVTEGQAVTKGQLLATLDPTLTGADLGQLTSQVAGLRAEVAREEAEQAKAAFAPTIAPGDPAAPYLALQKSLFDQRKTQYAAELASFDEKIQGQQATVAKLQADAASFTQREAIAQKIQDMRDTLFKGGASSLHNLLTATDTRVEMQRTMEFGRNSMTEAQHQIASLTADRDAFTQKWLSDLSQQLVTARTNLDAAVGPLDKARLHQDLVRVTAAEPGVVLSLAKISVGAVLKQGDPLMTVMPLGAPVQAEIEISPSDIGLVKVGDDVRLDVDAFASTAHGYVQGEVLSISGDTFQPDKGQKQPDASYKVKVRITGYKLIDVPLSFRLIPGMTLRSSITVGPRSLGVAVFSGVAKNVTELMREP